MQEYDIKFDELKTKVLKYIVYKKRTEREVFQKFSSYADKNLLEDVIKQLKELGYIDDEKYIERAVNEFLAINTLSLKEMRNKLYAKGIHGDIIDAYFSKNEEELQQYEFNCTKKIILKKQSQMAKEDIERFLLRKGYTSTNIRDAFEDLDT